MNIATFLERLDELDQSVNLEILKNLLQQLQIDSSEVREYMNFDDIRYLRNLVRRTDHYEALFLCFEAGQRTPIHDHSGSACGVRVIEGAAMETIFERTEDGWLYATGTSELPATGVVGSEDMDIHQLSNLQSGGKRLVTLHIYSPPLGEVGNYSIEDNSVTRVTAPTWEAVTGSLSR
ncbi:MAG: cysteine dioxygenase [Pirellulaceae bacterium]